uniref:VWFA domain-containing protein n=1 Tax=uncultured myxobacterium HF0200_19H16 TaxID=723559 RepID=E7C3W6_9BACT|nr:hypothetical protein [uncultured myxobacterium HF0200_19H16]
MIKLSKIKLFLTGSLAAILILSTGCADDVLVQLGTRTDEFLQQAAAEIDILWVVDNSNSMAANQQGLGQSFQSFIDNLLETGVDYHIGVVSTSITEGGRLSGTGFIDSTVSDPQSNFLSNVQVGTWGSPIERAFEAAALTLGIGPSWNPGDTPTPPNSNFLREDASLFIIMVSDEDDKSFGPVGYYRRIFEHYKGPGNEARISVSAIVGDPGEGCFEPTRGSAQPGTRYIDLASQTGGLFASICNDFSESLKELSINASGLQSRFELSAAPNSRARVNCTGVNSSAFCVMVDGQAIPEGTRSGRVGWTYIANTNSIQFLTDSIPGPQAKITVEYQEYR